MFNRQKVHRGNRMSRIEEIEFRGGRYEVEFTYRVVQCPALSRCDICGLKQISTFRNELDIIERIKKIVPPTLEEIDLKSLLGRQIARKLKSMQFFSKNYCILCDLP